MSRGIRIFPPLKTATKRVGPVQTATLGTCRHLSTLAVYFGSKPVAVPTHCPRLAHFASQTRAERFIERCNGRCFDQFPTKVLFSIKSDARNQITTWKQVYNRSAPAATVRVLIPA